MVRHGVSNSIPRKNLIFQNRIQIAQIRTISKFSIFKNYDASKFLTSCHISNFLGLFPTFSPHIFFIFRKLLTLKVSISNSTKIIFNHFFERIMRILGPWYHDGTKNFYQIFEGPVPKMSRNNDQASKIE